MSDVVMIAVRKAIRASDDSDVRLAPIITDECDSETYLSFIKIGFDDVLTLPDKRDSLVQRLKRQISVDYTYIKTADYLGLDRRRMEAPDHTDLRRRGHEGHFKLTIHRSVEQGCFVVRSDMFVAQAPGRR